MNDNEKTVKFANLNAGDHFWIFGTVIPKRVIAKQDGRVIYETMRGEKRLLPSHRKVIVDA